MSNVKKDYPARYYASYDTSAAQPTSVTGWYDVWSMSDVSNVPAASTMIAISESDWNNTSTFHLPIGKGVQNGEIIDYTPPAVVVPLATQAQSEMSGWISQQASIAVAMGETFTADMKTYVKTIQAIATGADKTSTTLPTRPTDVIE